ELNFIQQKATITTFGEKKVLLEMFSEDGHLRKTKLAGPHVAIHSRKNEILQIDDLNSASVGGVLDQDGVAFFGDLVLTSPKWNEKKSTPGQFRVTVYEALVEIQTIRIPPSDSVDLVIQQKTVPLNQQGHFIRSMKERARKLRDS
ncbi:MAG: hypothetical protein OXF48_04720, partial [Bacteroidetes bacterium]|nr:hypothetical protein [Bacteroidota bacterium]